MQLERRQRWNCVTNRKHQRQSTAPVNSPYFFWVLPKINVAQELEDI
jgi:hypothetical protein